MKISKKEQKRLALEQWWERPPWPAVILGIDPGSTAGATLAVSLPNGIDLVECISVDIMDREVERLVRYASTLAMTQELYLFLVLETWQSGGKLGLQQWVGLGEHRGPWKREFLIMAEELSSKWIRKKNIFQVNMARWRSRIIEETGVHKEDGKFRLFTSAEWKDKASNAANEFYLNQFVPPDDAAESACIVAYAARSDELGSRLPQRYLDRYSLTYSPLELSITGKK